MQSALSASQCNVEARKSPGSESGGQLPGTSDPLQHLDPGCRDESVIWAILQQLFPVSRGARIVPGTS